MTVLNDIAAEVNAAFPSGHSPPISAQNLRDGLNAVAADITALEVESLTAATGMHIPPGATFMRVAGYAAPGDGGEGLYYKVDFAAGSAYPTFQSADGANWFLDPHVPLRPEHFGAKGDGNLATPTDDHDAMQKALNYAFLQGIPLHLGSAIYAIGSPLVVRATDFNPILDIRGAAPSAGWNAGSVIQYIGQTATDVLFSGLGINNSSVTDVVFHGNYLLNTVCLLDYNFIDGIPGSQNTFENVTFVGAAPPGGGSTLLQIGTANFQMSECHFYNCKFLGAVDYGWVTTGANVKDFYFVGGAQAFCSLAAGKWGGSGVLSMQNVTFGANGCDLRPGAGTVILTGLESEDSRMLIWGPGLGQNSSSLMMIGCSFSGPCHDPANDPNSAFGAGSNVGDLLINYSGRLVMHGCWFENNRTGSSIPLIESDPSGLAAVDSRGNWFKNASGYFPLRLNNDMGTDPFATTAFTSQLPNAVLTSFGDTGGTGGAINVLAAVTMQEPETYDGRAMAPVSGSPAGAAYRLGRARRTVNRVTIPYTALTANATTQSLVLFTLGGARWRVLSVYAHVNTAFTKGGAETIVAQVGDGSTVFTAPTMLASFNAKVVADIGYAAGDLGTSLQNANLVQGKAARPNGDNIGIQFTCSTNLGNGTVTGLTAGSMDVFLVLERLD